MIFCTFQLFSYVLPPVLSSLSDCKSQKLFSRIFLVINVKIVSLKFQRFTQITLFLSPSYCETAGAEWQKCKKTTQGACPCVGCCYLSVLTPYPRPEKRPALFPVRRIRRQEAWAADPPCAAAWWPPERGSRPGWV